MFKCCSKCKNQGNYTKLRLKLIVTNYNLVMLISYIKFLKSNEKDEEKLKLLNKIILRSNQFNKEAQDYFKARCYMK